MKNSGTPRWSRLDNSAKIFPSNSTARDSKVFRFFCELYAPVDAQILQSALDKTMEKFPFYRSVMKRGLFWYYLEESSIVPQAVPETMPPCRPLFDRNRKGLLFRVLYYGRRISLEVYHALSDGNGALQFLCTLVYYYLLECHRDVFGNNPPLLGYNATQEQKRADSLKNIMKNLLCPKGPRPKKAYRMRGERVLEHRLSIVEGRMSLQALLECSRSRGSTLTELLTSVLILSIHEEMRLRDEKRPVVISIPVNLRGYFPSESARNFFTTINVGYDFSHQENSMDAVLNSVRDSFRKNLTKDQIRNRMNALCELEHSYLTRPIPLAVKNPVLRGASIVAERQTTASFSNDGTVRIAGGNGAVYPSVWGICFAEYDTGQRMFIWGLLCGQLCRAVLPP